MDKRRSQEDQESRIILMVTWGSLESSNLGSDIVVSGVFSMSPPIASGSGALGMLWEQEFSTFLVVDEGSWKVLFLWN